MWSIDTDVSPVTLPALESACFPSSERPAAASLRLLAARPVAVSFVIEPSVTATPVGSDGAVEVAGAVVVAAGVSAVAAGAGVRLGVR